MSEQQTLEAWLDQNDGVNNWGWQVIVDTLAIGENLPLRIIQYDSLQNLYKLIIEQLQQTPGQQDYSFKSSYPNKAAWDDYVVEVINWATSFGDKKLQKKGRPNLKTLSDLVEVYPLIASNIYPILPANPFPMEMLSHITFDEYRVFSLLWFYYWITIENQSPQKMNESLECNKNALAFLTMNMVSARIKDFDSDFVHNKKEYQYWIMVIGPCFGGNIPIFSEAEYDQEVIEPAINFIEHFSSGISQEQLFHKPPFRRAAYDAMPIPGNELKLRQKRVSDAITLLLACDITALNNTPTRHDLYHLTLWALFNSISANDIKRILTCQNYTLYFYYDYSGNYRPADKENARAHKRACFSVKQETADCIRLSVPEESTAPSLSDEEIRKQISEYGVVFQLNKNEINQKNLDKLRIQYSRFYLHNHHKRQSLNSKQLMIISGHLHREPGDNTSSLGSICQWLSDFLRSESTVLYRYDTHEREFGNFSVQDKYSRLLSNKQYRNTAIKNIEGIETEEEENRLLPYLAIKENCSKICLMYDPEALHVISHNNTAPDHIKNKDSIFRSAVAVPIRFNGRRQGAIEIRAYQPWQFSGEQQIVMEQAASVIAPFFYNQRFLEALSQINQEVLKFHHEQLTESDLYDGICYALANMFLCDGASFWVCKKNEELVLKQKGFHNIKTNIEEIDLNQKGFFSNKVFNLEQSDSIMPFITFSLDDMERGPPEIESLFEQNVKNLSLLLLYEQSSQSSKFMAAVTLYARDTIGFKDSWNGIMRYMSGFLPFVVEAVNAFVYERKAVTDAVQHEIWHDAAYLVNKATAMARGKRDLRQSLIQLTTLVQNDWFANRLAEASILKGWQRRDIESIKEIQHAADSFLFLPQEDMQYFAETLKTRINALFNDKELDKEGIKLLLEIGDRSIVDLIKVDETEQTIDLKLILNRLVEKHSDLSRKGVYFYNKKLPYILARKSIISTVLRNLLDNAIKYSVINSAITLEVEERRSGAIRLIIENEGRRMINLNECLDVLQKGIRGSNTKPKPGEKEEQGAGMGLYITQKLCKHVLRFDFSFRALPIGSRPEVLYIATLDIPANRVVRD